jgi:two-component system cell cycle response regulator
MNNRATVVIVDDDEILLDVVKKSLGSTLYSCETFTGAETALQHLSQKPCDMLITDIVMQGMEGLELTRRVKRMSPDTIVIVMTGFSNDFSYEQVIEAGASDFIKKPFSIHELLVRIKHVIKQEKLREMSITDELTGLPNRRGFFAVAQQQMKIANRTKGKLALLFADLDEFKSINDTWGHGKGDEALISIADIFRQTFRESDLIARMSGDEFAILLLNTPEENFSIIMQRLQKNIDAYNARAESTFRLAVSIGMAVFDHEQPCSIDSLLQQADARMYEHKQQRKKSLGLSHRSSS